MLCQGEVNNNLLFDSSWPMVANWSTAWPSIPPMAWAPSTLSLKCSSEEAGPGSKSSTWTHLPQRTEWDESKKLKWKRWPCALLIYAPPRCELCCGHNDASKLLVREWSQRAWHQNSNGFSKISKNEIKFLFSRHWCKAYVNWVGIAFKSLILVHNSLAVWTQW